MCRICLIFPIRGPSKEQRHRIHYPEILVQRIHFYLLLTTGICSALLFYRSATDKTPEVSSPASTVARQTTHRHAVPDHGAPVASVPSPAPLTADTIYVPHQVMARLAPGVDAHDLALDVGVKVLQVAQDGQFVLFAADAAGTQRLVAHAGVDSLAPNAVMAGATDDTSVEGEARNRTSSTPTHPYQSQWHLTNINALDTTVDHSGVVVAVIDSGIAYRTWCVDHECASGETPSHVQAPSLAGVSFVAPVDFTDGDLIPLDQHQHGTHVASLIASSGEVKGVAPNVTLMPVRVLDETNHGSEFNLIQGIYHAVDNGADILNLSLAFTPGYTPSPMLLTAIRYAHDNGVLMLGASGNQGSENAAWPAAAPYVFAVGASAPDTGYANAYYDFLYANIAHKASYSNLSTAIDLLAPGGDLSVDLTGDGRPDGILGETIAPQDPSQTGYWYFEGTSQATALATGAAVRLLAAGATPKEAAFALQYGGRPYNLEMPADGVGGGYLDVRRSSRVFADQYAPLQLNADIRVAVTPFLQRGSDGRVRPAAEISAFDVDNIFGSSVRVFSTITSAGESQLVYCDTDFETGKCLLTGDWVTLGDPMGHAWTIQTNLVSYATGVMAHPTGVLGATDALEAIFRAADAEGKLPDSFGLALFWDESAHADYGDVAASFTFMSGGTGLATSPLGVVATPAAVFPGVLVDDPTGSVGTGLATSPLGIATMDLQLALQTSGTGLATSPLGFTTLSLADFGGSGLATSPLGFTSVTFTPYDLNLDGTGLATSPLGYAPIGIFEFDGLSADGSTTTVVAIDGTGLATSPLGFLGEDLFGFNGGGVDLSGASLEGGAAIYDCETSLDAVFDGTTIGAVVEDGGFVSAGGYDVAGLLSASSIAGVAGSSVGAPEAY